jgi:hypothetical protein
MRLLRPTRPGSPLPNRYAVPVRILTVVALLGETAPALAQAQGPTTAADSMALAITIYSVALSNGTETAHAASLPEVVCVGGVRPGVDPPRAVIDALQENRTLLVRAGSACRTEPLIAKRSVSLVVDTLTGKRGISIFANEPTFAGDDTFTFNTGYYQHGLSGGGWTCKGRRRSDRQGWEVLTCTLTWIS